jgi:hypothetical protein
MSSHPSGNSDRTSIVAAVAVIVTVLRHVAARIAHVRAQDRPIMKIKRPEMQAQSRCSVWIAASYLQEEVAMAGQASALFGDRSSSST